MSVRVSRSPLFLCMTAGMLLSSAGGGTTNEADLLATDPRVVATSKTGYACVPSLAMNHLEGEVHIDLDQADLVTIRVPDDGDLSVRWPSGFTLVRGTAPHVVDPAGRPVARDGTHLSFPTVALESASGTPADPYVLLGRIGDDCYVLD